MFDAKSLLEALVNGGARTHQPQAQGGLGDILGQLGQVLGGAQQQGGQRGQAAGQGGGGGLEDLLRNMVPGAQGGGQAGGLPGGLGDIFRNMLPSGGQASAPQAGSASGGGGGAGGLPGGLGDILGKLGQQAGGAGAGAGGIADILRQVLGQATDGVREGARRVDDATGAGRHMRDAVGQATGRSPDELVNQLKDLIAKNQLGAGAALGGLGALVLGTRTGRSVAGSAIKLGALALIGGLAYKAYQNYSEGRPPLGGGNFVPEPAPTGSGFEPQAVTNETAALYIRAMIGSAAADGRIDRAEQERIMGGLKQAGLDAEAEEFLANELNNPATPEKLAAAVRSGEEAMQVYTAARLSIEPDTDEEQAYLAELAARLGVDAKLAAHVDAAARGAGA